MRAIAVAILIVIAGCGGRHAGNICDEACDKFTQCTGGECSADCCDTYARCLAVCVLAASCRELEVLVPDSDYVACWSACETGQPWELGH